MPNGGECRNLKTTNQDKKMETTTKEDMEKRLRDALEQMIEARNERDEKWTHYVNLARRFRNMQIHVQLMRSDAEHNVGYWDLPEVADLKKFHEGKLSACEEILQWIGLAISSDSKRAADAPADGKPDGQEENARAMTPATESDHGK